MEKIRDGFTRVTKPLSLFNNFSNIDPAVLSRACDRGTKVHGYCALYAETNYFPEPDEAIRGYLTSFQQWFDGMVDEVVLVEWRGYSEALRLTGAVDLIAKLRGDDCLTIIDYKTSQAISKSWALQTAAYKFLVEENTELKIGRRIALQISKDGKPPKVTEYTNDKQDWALYKAALALHRYFNGVV